MRLGTVERNEGIGLSRVKSGAVAHELTPSEVTKEDDKRLA